VKRLRTLGLSGPDGCGKTTLAAALADAARRHGDAAEVVHVYGCVLCRRTSGHHAPHTHVLPATGRRDPASGAGRPAHLDLLDAAHALLDATEMALRLAAARRRLRRAHGTTAVLITDRSPLDALVKYDPPLRSAVAAVWLRIAAGYSQIVVLDAPEEVLAERDREHTPAELRESRQRFARWAPLVACATPPTTELSPELMVSGVPQRWRQSAVDAGLHSAHD
jgi:AAA domain